jgi:hypothetical protein
MRGFIFTSVVLLSTIAISAAQNSATPRLDSEGNNMDAALPPSAQPRQPADPVTPSPDRPANGTTGSAGQGPQDERFPADRGNSRPVPSAPK